MKKTGFLPVRCVCVRARMFLSRAVRQTDTDRQTDGRTDGRIDRQKDRECYTKRFSSFLQRLKKK